MITLHEAAVPPCLQMLGSLGGLLTKAAAHAETTGIDPATLLQARLAPDMFPLIRQVQTATAFARSIGARLTGLPHEPVPAEETSFLELQARIAATLAFLEGLSPDAFDGGEAREIVLAFKTGDLRMTGQVYLQQFALPNLYFHVTTAYAILRHSGLALGKRDFVGHVTLLSGDPG